VAGVVGGDQAYASFAKVAQSPAGMIVLSV
jgi:hypothetical protein